LGFRVVGLWPPGSGEPVRLAPDAPLADAVALWETGAPPAGEGDLVRTGTAWRLAAAGAAEPVAETFVVRADRRPPEPLLSPLSALVRRSPDRQLWLTVVGYAADDDPPPTAGEDADDAWCERTAAAFLARLNILAFARGADKVFLRDELPRLNLAGRADTLLFEWDGAPRVALAALATQTRFLSGRLEPYAEIDERDAKICVFERDGGSVAAIWSTTNPATKRELRPGPTDDVQLCSLVGRPLAGGRMDLSEAPLYAVSETLPASALAQWLRAVVAE
jgi:hypothetical protein